ncbi:MAG TPA: hypothetical protein VEX60_02340 [Pyrinomonadaceae bacterium]|nr:hypothetical protein [Pyrinomonadaceae bacterium]
MKNILTAGGLASVLIFAGACSTAPAPANNTANTAATNTANRAASPANTSSTPAANTSNTSSANSSSSESGAQDFTLVNSTGVVINKLFISPHDKDDWEEDILGQDTLASGQSLEIKFDRDEIAEMWDLRVEDTQGNAIEWENLKLTEINKVTLHYKDGKATAETE